MESPYKHEIRQLHQIKDKVVVISGASSGIGAEIAKHFSHLGYKKLVLVKKDFLKNNKFENEHFLISKYLTYLFII